MPGMKSGRAYKLAYPYKGPYRIVPLHPNGAEVVLIERPQTDAFRVALNRIHRDPATKSPEAGDTTADSTLGPELQESDPIRLSMDDHTE
jgi:hypothetical protein